MSLKCNISNNASNRVTLETESFWMAWKVGLLLMFKYRLKRKGRCIPFAGESIFLDYANDPIKINSGWDSWFAYYWSADNPATDEFLTKFFRKHMAKN